MEKEESLDNGENTKWVWVAPGILASLVSLVLVGSCLKSCEIGMKNRKAMNNSIRIIAGEDRVIDYAETRKALDVLGYRGTTLNSKRERIYFATDDYDEEIEIYVGTQAPRPLFQDNRLLGTMNRDSLEKKILDAFGK